MDSSKTINALIRVALKRKNVFTRHKRRRILHPLRGLLLVRPLPSKQGKLDVRQAESDGERLNIA